MQKIKLIYATTNAAKLDMMSGFLQPLNIDVCGLEKQLPVASESGVMPIDNAREKALTYYSVLQKPLFSCDSGLFLEGVPQHLQPDVNVRNINGKALTDDEMIQYYSELAVRYGTDGMLIARYKNAICLVLDKQTIFEDDGADLSGEPFFICSKPHARRNDGFPIDSLSVHIQSRVYYYDLPKQHRGFSMNDGFRRFFARHLDAIRAQVSMTRANK